MKATGGQVNCPVPAQVLAELLFVPRSTRADWIARFSRFRHAVRDYNGSSNYFFARTACTNFFRREERANLFDHSTNTTQLHAWFARMRSGDPTAREELLRSTGERLERLARKMLK